MKKDRKNSGAYAKIFEEWNKNRTPLTLNGEDFPYIQNQEKNSDNA